MVTAVVHFSSFLVNSRILVRDSSLSIVTWVEAERPITRGSIPATILRVASPLICFQFWGLNLKYCVGETDNFEVEGEPKVN